MSEAVPHILVLNGVNLNLLGRRESEHYGRFTLADLEKDLQAKSIPIAEQAGFKGVRLEFRQTNQEAEFLEYVARPFSGALINAGAWTHTSLAIADALVATGLKFIEVHISNLARREELRQKSLLAPHALGVVFGLGMQSYHTGLFALLTKVGR